MRTLRPARLSRTLALVPPTIALVAQHASGAFDAYIKIGDIKGESMDEKHKDWIELHSVSWGLVRPISSPTGGGTTREAGVPKISELSLAKFVDSSSPELFLNGVGGTDPLTTVTLELVDSTSRVVFYRITLSDVLVSSQQHAASSGEDRPTESVSLNFTKIKIEYFKFDGKTTTAVPAVGWDLAKNTKL